MSYSDSFEELRTIMDRHGWAGTVFTRADVESVVQRDLTDEEWATVSGSGGWRKLFDNAYVMDVIWDNIRDLCNDLGIEADDDD